VVELGADRRGAASGVGVGNMAFLPGRRDLNAARLADWVRGLVQPTGGGSALPTFEQSLQPVLLVEGRQPETEFYAGVYLWASRAEAAAVVGEFSYIALVNPPTSGRIVTVEKIQVTTGTGVVKVTDSVAASSPWLAGMASAVQGDNMARDTRLIGRAFPSSLTLTGDNVASPFPGAQSWITSRDTTQGAIILIPGRAVVVESTSANLQLYGNFWFTERSLESRERTR
jgi:hypothetical protein